MALPSRGEAYLARALVALARARPTEGLSFAKLCGDRARVAPRLMNVLVITPAAEPGLGEALLAPLHGGAHVSIFIARGATDGADESAVRALRAKGMSATQVTGYEGIPRAMGEIAAQAGLGAAAS